MRGPVEYEVEKIPFVYPPRLAYYRPDFRLPNGIYIECKGLFPAEDRQKMVLVLQQHPELDIRMLFQRDQRLYPGSSETYTQWCRRVGIRCAVGSIPVEWFHERPRNATPADPRSIHLDAARNEKAWWRTSTTSSTTGSKRKTKSEDP